MLESADKFITDVIHLVEKSFDIVIDYHSITTIRRPYDYHLLTLKVSTTDNEPYLIKEFHGHTPQHLQTVFSELEKIRVLTKVY